MLPWDEQVGAVNRDPGQDPEVPVRHVRNDPDQYSPMNKAEGVPSSWEASFMRGSHSFLSSNKTGGQVLCKN